jgi:hypothetical protein
MDQIQIIASAINGYFDLMYDADEIVFPRSSMALVWSTACGTESSRRGRRPNSAT